MRHQRLTRVGSLVNKLVTPACQKQGFVQASILLDWSQIVGAKFAETCLPVKVTFPYGQRQNGRLHVQVSSGLAPELSFLEPMILERINRYFGYGAIGKLFIHQEPLAPRLHRPKKVQQDLPETRQALEDQLSDIQDEGLRTALLNLGLGIYRS